MTFYSAFKIIAELKLFVIVDEGYLAIEIRSIYDKLGYQYQKDKEDRITSYNVCYTKLLRSIIIIASCTKNAS